MSDLIEIDEGVFILPSEVVSIEDYEHWSDYDEPSGGDFLISSGSVIVLKNGRKIYLKNTRAKEAFEKLQSGKEQE